MPKAVGMDPREKPEKKGFAKQHLTAERKSLNGGCGLRNEHQTTETSSSWKQGCQSHGNQASDLLHT